MPSFGDLKLNTYYLIQIDEESDIELVSVLLQTKETVLLRSYLPQGEDFFQFIDESIYRLVEELDEETAERYEALYAAAAGEEETFEYDEEE
jgi:hypothetical protein